jgi:hypothetical protein
MNGEFLQISQKAVGGGEEFVNQFSVAEISKQNEFIDYSAYTSIFPLK